MLLRTGMTGVRDIASGKTPIPQPTQSPMTPGTPQSSTISGGIPKQVEGVTQIDSTKISSNLPDPSKYWDKNKVMDVITKAQQVGDNPDDVFAEASKRGYVIEGYDDFKRQQVQEQVKKSPSIFENILGVVQGAGQRVASSPSKLVAGVTDLATSGFDKIFGTNTNETAQKFTNFLNNAETNNLKSMGLDPESMYVKGGQLVADIGVGLAPIPGTQGLKVLNAIKNPLLRNALQGAVSGAVGTQTMKMASEGKSASLGETALGAAAGGALGGAIAGVPMLAKKLAPELQLSGLLNPSKLDAVSKQLIDEGVGLGKKDPAEVGKWMISRGMQGNKEEIVTKLDNYASDAIKQKAKILQQTKGKIVSKDATEGLTQMIKDIEGKAGLKDEVAQLKGMLRAGDEYTVPELEAIKGKIDDVYNIYKQSGDVGAGVIKQGLNNIRKSIRLDIERQVAKEGLGNIRKLNNEISTSKTLSEAIQRKEASDYAREMVSFLAGRTPGALLGGATGYQTSGGDWKYAIGGMLLGGLTGSTKAKTWLASKLGKLSGIQKKTLKDFVESKGQKTLPDDIVNFLNKTQQEAKQLALPYKGSLATPVTPKGQAIVSNPQIAKTRVKNLVEIDNRKSFDFQNANTPKSKLLQSIKSNPIIEKKLIEKLKANSQKIDKNDFDNLVKISINNVVNKDIEKKGIQKITDTKRFQDMKSDYTKYKNKVESYIMNDILDDDYLKEYNKIKDRIAKLQEEEQKVGYLFGKYNKNATSQGMRYKAEQGKQVSQKREAIIEDIRQLGGLDQFQARDIYDDLERGFEKTKKHIEIPKEIKDKVSYDDFDALVNNEISKKDLIKKYKINKVAPDNFEDPKKLMKTQTTNDPMQMRGTTKPTVDKELQPLYNEAKKYKSVDEFIKKGQTPKSLNLWVKSKFSEKGSYKKIPVLSKIENTTLYQGGSDGKRQFWTTNKKYAAQFGEVKSKKGNFYQVDNGNRLIDVYVDVDDQLRKIREEANK